MNVSDVLRKVNASWIGREGSWFSFNAIPLWVAVLYGATVMSLASLSLKGVPILPFIAMSCCMLLVLSYVNEISRKISQTNDQVEEGCVQKVFLWIAVGFSCLGISACFTYGDTEWQWAQATGNMPLDDWHPVAHTVLLSLVRLFLRNYCCVVSFQCLVFVGLIYVLKHSLVCAKINFQFVMWILMIVVFSPFTLYCLRVLWKDTVFAFCVLAIVALLIQVFESRGRTLSWWKVVLMSILIAYASFVRHNGVFYTCPLIILLPITLRGAKIKGLLISVISLFLMIGYICFRAELKEVGIIQTSCPGQHFAESVGLPMSMMSESYVKHPERTPKETSAFLETICSREQWLARYEGTYNSVKFSISNPTEKMNAVTPKDFAVMCFKTFKSNPISCVKSFLHITQQAWSPLPTNLSLIVTGGDGFWGANIVYLQRLVLLSPLGCVMAAPGFVMLIMVVSFCWKLRSDPGRALLFFVPIAAYHFGTMFFLTGFDWRFFFPTILVGYPISLVLLKKESRDTEKS